jgi:glyoxylase-like metal-dependent hydrolase (beta-lactamase superfamily II)
MQEGAGRIQRFRVGMLEVVRIVELEFPLGREILPVGRDPEALAASADWARPHFVTDDGAVVFAVSTVGVVSEGRRVLIDPCMSFDLRRGNPDIEQKAEEYLDGLLPLAGFAPEQVELVVNTHIDGVGWNVRPGAEGWRPAFPRARCVFTRRELDRVASGEFAEKEALRPLLDAGVVDAVEAPCQITPHVRLSPSPGHTVGNVDVWIESEGASAVIVGDHLLNPLQCADPDWTGLDMEPDAAPRIRRALLEECEAREALVIGPHFGAPGAGRVRREGEAWQLVGPPAG